MKALRESISNLVKEQAENSKMQAISSEEVKGMKNAAQAGIKMAESEAEKKVKQAEKEKKDAEDKVK